MQQELLQWDNLVIFLILNIFVTNLAPFLSLIAWATGAFLYIFPGLATTPSNKIDKSNPTDQGIPIGVIWNSVVKIWNNPFDPIIWFFEGYILVLDFCHVLAYLVEYIQEYLAFEQDEFPRIFYRGRSGSDLANDLIALSSWISAWQFIGTPFVYFTVAAAPYAFVAWWLQGFDMLGGL